ncbi:MAG TPA: hypothetical protein VGM05_11840 [Planctomycetaceae bacterium]|jgi:hypothetical protein
MSTEIINGDVTKELQDAMDRLVRRVRAPEVGRRAREEMDRMREETRQRVGTIEVAVDLVRDARNT